MVEVFKRHSYDISRVLSGVGPSCLPIATELYAKGIISEWTQRDIAHKIGVGGASFQVVSSLVSSLEIKIRYDGTALNGVLDVLATEPALEVIVNKIRLEVVTSTLPLRMPADSVVKSHSREVNPVEVANRLQKTVERNDRIKRMRGDIIDLQTKFERLIPIIKKGLDTAYVEEIKTIIRTALSATKITKDLENLIQKLIDLKTTGEVIDFLVQYRFCSYLNYRVLINIAQTYGNTTCKESTTEYEEDFIKFAKRANLHDFVQDFLEENELGPSDVFGLPRVVFSMDDQPWRGWSLYTYLETISTKFSEAWRYMFGRFRGGSIIVEYMVFPEDINSTRDNVKRSRNFLQALKMHVRVSRRSVNPPEKNSEKRCRKESLTKELQSLEMKLEKYASDNEKMLSEMKQLREHQNIQPEDRQHESKFEKAIKEEIEELKKMIQGIEERSRNIIPTSRKLLQSFSSLSSMASDSFPPSNHSSFHGSFHHTVEHSQSQTRRHSVVALDMSNNEHQPPSYEEGASRCMFSTMPTKKPEKSDTSPVFSRSRAKSQVIELQSGSGSSSPSIPSETKLLPSIPSHITTTHHPIPSKMRVASAPGKKKSKDLTMPTTPLSPTVMKIRTHKRHHSLSLVTSLKQSPYLSTKNQKGKFPPIRQGSARSEGAPSKLPAPSSTFLVSGKTPSHPTHIYR